MTHSILKEKDSAELNMRELSGYCVTPDELQELEREIRDKHGTYIGDLNMNGGTALGVQIHLVTQVI